MPIASDTDIELSSYTLIWNSSASIASPNSTDRTASSGSGAASAATVATPLPQAIHAGDKDLRRPVALRASLGGGLGWRAGLALGDGRLARPARQQVGRRCAEPRRALAGAAALLKLVGVGHFARADHAVAAL